MAATPNKSKAKSNSGSGSKASSKKAETGSETGSKSGSRTAAKSTSAPAKTKTSKSSSSSSTSRAAKPAEKAGSSASKGSTKGSTSKAASQDENRSKSTGTATKRTASGGAKKTSGRTNSTSSKSSKTTGKAGSGAARNTGKAKKQGIVGKVASAIGGLLSDGEKDVLELLKEDHRIVDGYFQEVKANEDANHEKTFKKIKAELDVHAHVEEVIFYPHLLKVGSEDLQKIVREGVEEHTQVKTLLEDLSGLRGGDDVFKAKLKVLMENVEHHVQEEEDEMFSMVEEEVDREALTALAEQVETEKANFKGGSRSKTARGNR